MTGRLVGRVYLRTGEAAELLGVSDQAVRRALREGRLRGMKLKGRWRVLASAILDYERR